MQRLKVEKNGNEMIVTEKQFDAIYRQKGYVIRERLDAPNEAQPETLGVQAGNHVVQKVTHQPTVTTTAKRLVKGSGSIRHDGAETVTSAAAIAAGLGLVVDPNKDADTGNAPGAGNAGQQTAPSAQSGTNAKTVTAKKTPAKKTAAKKSAAKKTIKKAE